MTRMQLFFIIINPEASREDKTALLDTFVN
jgi:hypothetical protein